MPHSIPASDGRSPRAAALDASTILEGQNALDTVIGWVAWYLPTWGTSLLLHAAVLLMVAFTVSFAEPVKTPFVPVFGTPVFQRQPNVQHRAVQPERPSRTSRERPAVKFAGAADKPQSGLRGSLLNEALPNPIPDVADNGLQPLDVFGIGGGGNHRGGFIGLPLGRSMGGLFDSPAVTGHGSPPRIVYIVDRSGSMTDAFEYVKLELKRSLDDLDEAAEFHVIFFSTGPAVEMPARRLVSASDRNRQAAFEFIDSVVPMGETDPTQAIERAFAAGPTVIYLLTDGEFDRSIVSKVKRLNTGGKVTVNTIAFLYEGGTEVLREIAKQNGGEFKLITEKDLAASGSH